MITLVRSTVLPISSSNIKFSIRPGLMPSMFNWAIGRAEGSVEVASAGAAAFAGGEATGIPMGGVGISGGVAAVDDDSGNDSGEDDDASDEPATAKTATAGGRA